MIYLLIVMNFLVGVSVGVDCNAYTLGLIDMTHYILDSSVATHVLDGDLWSRKPATITRYRTELKYSQFPMERWEEDCIKFAVAALKWARDISVGGIRLWITPTVENELSCAPQVCILYMQF